MTFGRFIDWIEEAIRFVVVVFAFGVIVMTLYYYW